MKTLKKIWYSIWIVSSVASVAGNLYIIPKFQELLAWKEHIPKVMAARAVRSAVKCKAQRGIVAASIVPGAGLAIAAAFEYNELAAWKRENPDEDIEGYAKQIEEALPEVYEEEKAALQLTLEETGSDIQSYMTSLFE